MMDPVPLDTTPTRALIGRARELDELVEMLAVTEYSADPSDRTGSADTSTVGRGAVLLSGDAGVGKSRLLTELTGVAVDRSWQVLTGHCLDFGDSALPYLPFSELFGRLAADAPAAAEATASAHPAVRRLMPTIRLNRDAEQSHADAVDRGDLFEAVHAALEHLGRSQPVLIVVEDVHWADQSTREMLSFLFARRFTQPVSLVASYRSDDLHRRHPLRTSVAEWSRLPSVQRLALSPLSDAHVRTLIHAIHPAPIAAPEMQMIVSRAEGNAFFTEELVGATMSGKRSLPGDLADLLLVRLDQLDDTSRKVVRATSVAGRRVSHDLLTRVVEIDADSLDSALRMAVEHNVLVPVGDDSYAFRHALLAEAVYDDLLPGERVRLHRAYTEVLRDAAVSSTAAEVARHALAAHDLPTAITASIEAGDEAMSVGGPDEASKHYQVALELLADEATHQSAEVRQVDVVGLTIKTSEAVIAAGHVYRAVDIVRDQIGHLSPTLDEPDRVRLLLALASASLLTETNLDVVEVTSEAMALSDDKPPSPLKAELLSIHARAHAARGDDTEAARWANEALSLGSEYRIASVVADATTTLSMVNKRIGDPDASKKALIDIIGHARSAGDVMGELRSLHNLGYVHYEQGRLEEALAVYQSAVQRAVQAGRPWAPYGIDSRVLAAITAYMSGDWQLVRQLVDVSGQTPPPVAEALLSSVSMILAAGQGDASATGSLKSLRRHWEKDGMIAIVGGSAGIDLYGDSGDLEAAVALHDEVVETVGKLWETSTFQARVRLSGLLIGQLATHVTTSGSAERPGIVRQGDKLMAIADDTMSSNQRRKRLLGLEGQAWHARVRAEHARLRWLSGVESPSETELVEAWLSTVEAFDKLGHRFETARSQARAAAALRGSGRAAEAKPLTDAATATARELGAEPLLRELRTLGGRTTKAVAAGSGEETLTSREHEVLTLVAQGRSNAEIATQLFISPKTASVHVSHIMAKLGASSRTEAAALGRQRGWVG
jgi:DNA-binding CsgD family transcriptional regulator/tetratricopeptide (TPR) repeat protein